MEENRNCPFCGGNVVATKGVFNAPFFMFKCQNKDCGAVISFNNVKANKEPIIAFKNFNNRFIPEAEWVETDRSIGVQTAYECSKCKYEVHESRQTNYCPNCGRKMKLKE